LSGLKIVGTTVEGLQIPGFYRFQLGGGQCDSKRDFSETVTPSFTRRAERGSDGIDEFWRQ
jgi:hypothetical protein